jgi:hypothetical protein
MVSMKGGVEGWEGMNGMREEIRDGCGGDG